MPEHLAWARPFVCFLRWELLHLGFDEVDDAGEEVVTGATAEDAVIAVRIELHIELLVGLHEGFCHFGAVAVVHIVVGGAVDEEEFAVELCSTRHGVHGVVVAILLRGAHIAFSIDGVIVLPVGGGSDSHAAAEERTTIGHGHERIETTEAPAPERDSIGIDVGKRGEVLRSLHLVLRFEVAETEVGALLEFSTASTRAATIDDDGDVAELSEVAFPNATAIEARVPSVLGRLRTRAAVLVHHDGVTAIGVEIAGFHHPAVELHAFRSRKGEELLLAADLVDASFEFGVVDERSERLARSIAEGSYGRLTEGGVDVHEVAHTLSEGRVVRTAFGREALNLALLVGRVNRLAEGTLLVRSEEEAAAAFVVAVEIAHVEVAAGDGGGKLTREGVPIEVLIARAVGEHHEVAVVEFKAGVGFLNDIFVVGFTKSELRHAAAGINHIEVHAVLMAIERHDSEAVGVGGHGNARNVAIGIERHGELARGTALEVVAMERDGGVSLSRDGIFVIVRARIVGVFRHLGTEALEHLHVVDGHLTFVVAQPAKHFAIGRKLERAACRKLFFVHPVGNTIDDFVALTVGRHLRFGVVVKEFYDKEVVVAGKSHHVAVGREKGRHLRTAFREGRELAVERVVNIVDRGGGAAIDGRGLGLEKDFLLVGTHDITVDAVEFHDAARFFDVENDTDFLARFERRTNDALAIGRELGVAFAVVHGIHAVDLFGRELILGNVGEGNALGGGLCHGLVRGKGTATQEERQCQGQDAIHKREVLQIWEEKG